MLSSLAIATCAACIVSCAKPAAGEKATPGAVGYKVIIAGHDWGPSIDKLVLELDRKIDASSVDKDDFSVYVERKDPANGRILKLKETTGKTAHESKGVRELVDAYASDAAGDKRAEGKFITLVMEIGPTQELAMPFNFDMKIFRNGYVEVAHSITLKGSLTAADDGAEIRGLRWTPSSRSAVVSLVADDFDTKGLSEYVDDRYGKIVLRYASFAPAKDGKRHPLIIWLHGSGEGGADPYLALLGNRVTALAVDPIQGIFGGAYVLVPQTPTSWMNDGERSFTKDGSSRYTKALKALIDAYLAGNEGIDARRVYIGGCSSGGFMTMNMILSYPGSFAAAYPICEAYADKWISDAQIASIRDIPIWFTQSKSDRTVDAAAGGYVLETYKRLKAAGARNLRLSYWDKVEDLSGLYFMPDGKTPYEYSGHWSWIYVLNDQCRKDAGGEAVRLGGKEVSIMEWLAAQAK